MATEQRLIDANNLSVMIEETAQGLADCDQQNAAWALRKYAIRDITEAPTVDAAPVVHGRWIRRGNEMKCSNPKCQFIYYSNNDDFNYCPNCGAKMDGRSDNG